MEPEAPLLPRETLAQGRGRSLPSSAHLTTTGLLYGGQLLSCPPCRLWRNSLTLTLAL